MDVKGFIKKVQELPEGKRKIILWSVLVALGLVLVFLWIWNIKTHFKGFQKEKFIEDLGVPSLQEKFNDTSPFPTPPLDIKKLIENGNLNTGNQK